jgi:hypothetical protein
MEVSKFLVSFLFTLPPHAAERGKSHAFGMGRGVTRHP